MNTEQQLSVIEGNKIIAQFIGAKIINPIGNCMRTIEFPEVTFGLRIHNENKLEYNSSWDWLMPVIKKIREYYYTYVEKKNILDVSLPLISGMNEVDINKVWQAAIQFIQWYNSQKQ